MFNFGKNQAQMARYAYESLPYTPWPFAASGSPSSLNAGETPLFNVRTWNPMANNQTWQARLEMVQGTQDANIQFKVQSDGFNRNSGQWAVEETQSLTAGSRQVETLVVGNSLLALYLENAATTPAASVQFNYRVGMKRQFAAEKVMLGLPLTAQEQQALTALDVGHKDQNGNFVVDKTGLSQLQRAVARGNEPNSLERVLSGRWDNRILQGAVDFHAPSATSADNPFYTYDAVAGETAAEGSLLVLTGIGFPGSTNATLTVDRDGQNGYLQLQGAAFAQADGHMWDCWVPALEYLTFHVTNGPGATGTNTVPLQLRVEQFAMSEILAIQFGRISHAEQASSPALFARVIAGLI